MHTVAELVVRVEKGPAVWRVVACEVGDDASMKLEITYSTSPERISFRLSQLGLTHLFTHDQIARHPALSAVLRLIQGETDTAKRGGSTSDTVAVSSQALLPLLCRSLLVYVTRIDDSHVLPGYGRPLRDSRIERALGLLNQDISKRWTVELLARAVGLSRPVFARQFLRFLGSSPMRYLTKRRMEVAASLLVTSDASLAEVAARVGYESEFAFNRAFKRHYRLPPGEYRRRFTLPLYHPIRMAA